MSQQPAPSRYRPLQVSLHWLTFLLITAAFVVGKNMSRIANDDAGKIAPLAIHMTIGVLILLAVIIRIAALRKFPPPAPISTGNAALDVFAKLTHGALYLFTLLMALSGISLSLQAGIGKALLGGGALPADFLDFTARALHGFIAPALFALIVLHIVGALYHQLVLKDELMDRMKVGK